MRGLKTMHTLPIPFDAPVMSKVLPCDALASAPPLRVSILGYTSLLCICTMSVKDPLAMFAVYLVDVGYDEVGILPGL